MSTFEELRACAHRIRRYALRMGEVQGQGYIGQALGWADVLATAYCHAMNVRPAEPEWEGRDRFLLSHGHYAIAHYAALIEAGIISEGELETYGSDDSRLPMSGMAAYTPGMEISGGSLGQGLAIGVGIALAVGVAAVWIDARNTQRDLRLDRRLRPFDRIPHTRLSADDRRRLWDVVVAMSGAPDPLPELPYRRTA